MTEIIKSNPEILQGKPIFKGTRIPVNLVYELLGLNYSIKQILNEYPTLSKEMIVFSLKIGKDALEQMKLENLTDFSFKKSIES